MARQSGHGIGRRRFVSGGSAAIALRGRVVQHVYYGRESHILVEDASGRAVAASITNVSRQGRDHLPVGKMVWLVWRPEDCVALSD